MPLPSMSLSQSNADKRVPSFDIVRSDDASKAVTFAGLPMGHEFTSLVLALLQVGVALPGGCEAAVVRVAASPDENRLSVLD